MKFTVTLEGNIYEDRDALEDYVKGPDWRRVVEDLDNFLRSEIKYGDLSRAQYKFYEKIREQLHQLMAEYRLSLY